MEKKPLVAIVLVNYNGYDDTVECVQGILQSDYPNYRIIIVDNASDDAPVLREDTFLNAHADIVYSDTNDGFATGNNIGIREAEALNPEYVFALNNDTVIDRECISRLVNELENNKKAAIATGTIRYFDNPDSCWYCGGTYSRLTGRTHQNIYSKEPEKESLTVSFASGCAMMIRMSFLREHGIFDESFFMYSEDTELCCRAIDADKEIRWVPGALIYHKAGKSITAGSIRQQYLIIRNSLIMLDRYGTHPGFGRLVWKAYCKYRELKGTYDREAVKKAFEDSRK